MGDALHALIRCVINFDMSIPKIQEIGQVKDTLRFIYGVFKLERGGFPNGRDVSGLIYSVGNILFLE